MGPGQTHVIYEFGEFQLDALRRVLSSRDGQPLQVTGRVFDTLLYFVERAGELLDKRSLMEAFWPNLVVEESNLTQMIYALRRVLGERPDEHRFIVTVPGRGYRFVADVITRPASEPAPGLAAAHREPVQVRPHRRRLLAIIAAAVMVLAAVPVLINQRKGEAPRATAVTPLPSIAVLAFVDMSPQRNQEYFADGLSEEIINLLAQSNALQVIARTSSFSFKHQNVDIATIAGRLHVTHVLEGSVRRSGDRVRITAQLVDTKNSAHLWSETFDREVKDVFEVQVAIATSVAESLQVTLTGDNRPTRGETDSAPAYELYLQALYYFNRRGAADLERARDYFEQALRIDAGYARAWAGLAGTYYVAREPDGAMPEDALRKWREAVERALALGPDVAETRMRAAQYYFMTGDARASDEHFKRAIALNPSDPLVLGASASFAVMKGDLNEAISLWRRAVTVDPLSATSRFNLGLHLLAVEKLEEAKAELQKARAMRATSREDIDAEIAKILMLQQHFDEALAMAVELPDSPRRDQCLALIHHAIGNAPSADAALARLIAASKRSDSGVAVKLSIAEVYAFRGESDDAFRWLGDANRQTHDDLAVVPNWWTRGEMQISPFLKSLHADPRWQVYDAAIRARI